MPLDRLAEFEGAGIYYAATEVEARWCRETEVVVIGGGNSAGQAAMFLSRVAKHVHVLVRGQSLAASMSAYLVERLQKTPNITIHYRAQVTRLEGERSLQSVVIHSGEDGQDWTLNARAVFVMVGAAPNTGWLQGRVAVDGNGFVLTGADAGEGRRRAGAMRPAVPASMPWATCAQARSSGWQRGGRRVGGDFRGVEASEPLRLDLPLDLPCPPPPSLSTRGRGGFGRAVVPEPTWGLLPRPGRASPLPLVGRSWG